MGALHHSGWYSSWVRSSSPNEPGTGDNVATRMLHFIQKLSYIIYHMYCFLAIFLSLSQNKLSRNHLPHIPCCHSQAQCRLPSATKHHNTHIQHEMNDLLLSFFSLSPYQLFWHYILTHRPTAYAASGIRGRYICLLCAARYGTCSNTLRKYPRNSYPTKVEESLYLVLMTRAQLGSP